MNPQEPTRLSVSDAAKLFNVTPEAIRQRVRRGTIEHERTEDGRVYVYVTPSEDVGNGVGNTSGEEQLRVDYVETLKRELESRNRELAEMRRLLAGALERIPAIEAPESLDTASSEPRESPQTASEEPSDTQAPPDTERRQLRWWQRWFVR